MRDILTCSKKISKSKTLAIHNGIPSPVKRNRVNDSAPETFTIGSAGRLVPVKDFDLFIAIANLLKSNSKIRFLLAGEGPLFKELERKHSEFQLYNFIFLGHIEDMNLFYSQIDVFVNTSIHEGIPMTILEAMSRGIPVVAPHIGGIPEIIEDDVDGFLIHNRDSRQYAEKCSYLSVNKDRYRIMAEAAKDKIINKFSISSMTNRYIQTYSEIVSD
jgi:glycosyltransferase involved in cell wall biosynthesis